MLRFISGAAVCVAKVTPTLLGCLVSLLGLHTFTWSYLKDGGGGATDMEEDCAGVDYISFPPSMLEDDGVLGDVNGDGVVSVLDVVQIVNMVLESEYNASADVNGDGSTDVLDVILIVIMIL